MNTPATELYREIGDLKAYLRLVLDPERVKTAQEVREAKDEAHALLYRSWRKHLVPLAKDDLLARHFFEAFGLVEYLHQTCKEGMTCN